MMKNKKLILGISLLVLLAYLVMAAAGDNVKIVSLSSGTNMTSITNKVFNVSFDNSTDIPNALNATFFFNVSGTWTKIGNTTATGCNVKAGLSSCAVTLNVTGIDDGVYSLNATIYNASASISVTSITNLSNIIYLDSTGPRVSLADIITPISGGNYSQNLVLNTSASDATIGIQTIFFNITNRSSGLQNSTNTASREGSTSQYSVTINTTYYPNGYYNITVYANDTLGNANNSAFSGTVAFDNIIPTADYTCDDYTVQEDEDMDCTCTGTDSFTGVASEDFDASPSTSSVGDNFQLNCTVTDKAGNIVRDAIYYNVSEVTGSTSGGSSGGSSTGTTTGGNTTSGNTNSSSTNSSTVNSTSTNSSANANQLQGNQQNQNESDFKINYWILGSIIIGAGLAVAIFILIKKGIIQRILKFNK